MFAPDQPGQDLWTGEDALGSSIIPSLSGAASDFDNFTSDVVSGKQPCSTLTKANDQRGPIKTPGVLRTTDAALLRDGQTTLPAEKAFAIQIGWKLYRLSGASIMSDGMSVLRTAKSKH